MTKDISKKIVSIDDREKKITRLADKIDNMFVEINKRLEEFMFYKAKQDSLDDLSKEMLKSMDELTTKLTRYAEKDDLELLRDTMDNKISALMKEGGAPAPVQMRQESEMESLMKLLEEQYRKGQISKKDYEKAKAANVQKTGGTEPAAKKAELPAADTMEGRRTGDRQPEAVKPSTPSGKKEETVIDQTPPVEEEALPEEQSTEPTEEPQKETGEEPAPGEEEVSKPEEPEPTEPKPKEKKPAPAKSVHVKKTAATAPKPRHEEPEEEEPAEDKSDKEDIKPEVQPESVPTKDEIAKKIGRAKEGSPESKPEKPLDKKQKMLADLDYSLRKGLISQKAYENAQRVIASIKF
jgi:hypothetical protein